MMLPWLAVLVITVCHLTQGADAAYGFGDDYEENFIEFYAAERLLMKCYYGSHTLDTWQKHVSPMYLDCKLKNSMLEYINTDEEKALDDKMKGLKPFFGRAKIKKLHFELKNNMNELKCFFRALNLEVGPGGIVLGTPLREYLQKEKSMPDDLKESLYLSITDCETASVCGSDDTILLGKEHVHFFKLVKFYKCWLNARLNACIKHDIATNDDKFEFAGLDTFMQDVDNVNVKRQVMTSLYFNDQNKLGGLWSFD